MATTVTRRRKTLAQKKAAKDGKMAKPGHESNYAKKKAYLHKRGGWGFDYKDKPWK